MNRTFLVLALALSTVWLPDDGSELRPADWRFCAVVNAPSCHMRIQDNAPRPGGCCEGVACNSCGRGGSLDRNLPGRQRLRVRSIPRQRMWAADIRMASMIARHAARRTGAATVISTRAATRIVTSAMCQNGQGCQPNCLCQHCGHGYCWHAVRRRVARAARSAAAVRRATRITTSILVRRSLRRLTRTTRCVVRAISC